MSDAWFLFGPDPNIDHRRVDNLAVFFTRHGLSLPVTKEAADYKPGDVVAWRLPDGRPHMGLVSDRSTGGRPLIVHNIGAGAYALRAFPRRIPVMAGDREREQHVLDLRGSSVMPKTPAAGRADRGGAGPAESAMKQIGEGQSCSSLPSSASG